MIDVPPVESYRDADPIVTTQRCAFGDDHRGYCGQRATEHIWMTHPDVEDGGHTMACDEHRQWFDDHPHRDRHPVVGACGMPNSEWIDSHPIGGPGWCELNGFDWLAAVEQQASWREGAQGVSAT